MIRIFFFAVVLLGLFPKTGFSQLTDIPLKVQVGSDVSELFFANASGPHHYLLQMYFNKSGELFSFVSYRQNSIPIEFEAGSLFDYSFQNRIVEHAVFPQTLDFKVKLSPLTLTLMNFGSAQLLSAQWQELANITHYGSEIEDLKNPELSFHKSCTDFSVTPLSKPIFFEGTFFSIRQNQTSAFGWRVSSAVEFNLFGLNQKISYEKNSLNWNSAPETPFPKYIRFLYPFFESSSLFSRTNSGDFYTWKYKVSGQSDSIFYHLSFQKSEPDNLYFTTLNVNVQIDSQLGASVGFIKDSSVSGILTIFNLVYLGNLRL